MQNLEHQLRAKLDPLYWLRKCTRTKDEQDDLQPYKPFPDWPCFDVLRHYWDSEPVVYIEKSRSVLLTWFVTGMCMHMSMTRPATCVVYLGPDEDRTNKCLDYSWTLWEQQEAVFQAAWPYRRRLREPFNPIELHNDSRLLALPGKNPDKIRSEHPTIVVLDEGAFIAEGKKAHDVAMATKCKKLVVLTSAEVGWFRDLTKPAVAAAA